MAVAKIEEYTRQLRHLGHKLVPLVMLMWAHELGFTTQDPNTASADDLAKTTLQHLYFLEHSKSWHREYDEKEGSDAQKKSNMVIGAFFDEPLLPGEPMPLGTLQWITRHRRIKAAKATHLGLLHFALRQLQESS
jgi:hypothetical protein